MIFFLLILLIWWFHFIVFVSATSFYLIRAAKKGKIGMRLTPPDTITLFANQAPVLVLCPATERRLSHTFLDSVWLLTMNKRTILPGLLPLRQRYIRQPTHYHYCQLRKPHQTLNCAGRAGSDRGDIE